MKTNTQANKRKGFTLVELLVVIAIIAALAGLVTPAILNARKEASKAEAISNARQIGIFLFSFEQNYGSFPSDATETIVVERSGKAVSSAGGSNKYLSQLIAAGYTDSEEIFYTKGGVIGGLKPDGVITGNKVLESKECGFGYVMASATDAFSTSYNGSIPIVVSPVSDADSKKFNPAPFNNQAVYLRLDTSVKTGDINKDGEVVITGTQTLYTTGPDTYWGTGITPTVQAPQ